MVIRVIYYNLSCKVQITLEGCKRKRDQGNAYLGVMDTSLGHPQQLFQAHEFYFWCLKPGVMQRIFHTAHIVLWACHPTLSDHTTPGNKWYFWTKMPTACSDHYSKCLQVWSYDESHHDSLWPHQTEKEGSGLYCVCITTHFTPALLRLQYHNFSHFCLLSPNNASFHSS